MFGVQELASAVQYKITLIFSNNAYGNVRRDQARLYDGHIHGSELESPDFVALAKSFGAAGYRADSADELHTLLETTLVESAAGPVVIEVLCERGSEASPFEFLMPANYGR